MLIEVDISASPKKLNFAIGKAVSFFASFTCKSRNKGLLEMLEFIAKQKDVYGVQ